MSVTMKLITLNAILMVVIAVAPASTQTTVHSVCVMKTLLQKLIFHVRVKVTQCGSHFENLPSMALPRPHDNAPPLPFRLQIALDLSYLETEGQGRGIIMRVWRCHRRQGVKNPPRTCKKSTKNAFRGERAWRRPDYATPTFRVSN